MKKIPKKWLGLRSHRLKSSMSLREEMFAREWASANGERGVALVDHLCCPLPGDFRYVPTADDRDRVIANTVIQWLGTNVGQAFLEKVDRATKAERAKRTKARKKKCPERIKCVTKGGSCLCDFEQ